LPGIGGNLDIDDLAGGGVPIHEIDQKSGRAQAISGSHHGSDPLGGDGIRDVQDVEPPVFARAGVDQVEECAGGERSVKTVVVIEEGDPGRLFRVRDIEDIKAIIARKSHSPKRRIGMDWANYFLG
jgi:hypothetical protein